MGSYIEEDSQDHFGLERQGKLWSFNTAIKTRRCGEGMRGSEVEVFPGKS